MREPYMWRTPNISWRVCVIVKQILSNPIQFVILQLVWFCCDQTRYTSLAHKFSFLIQIAGGFNHNEKQRWVIINRRFLMSFQLQNGRQLFRANIWVHWYCMLAVLSVKCACQSPNMEGASPITRPLTLGENTLYRFSKRYIAGIWTYVCFTKIKPGRVRLYWKVMTWNYNLIVVFPGIR